MHLFVPASVGNANSYQDSKSPMSASGEFVEVKNRFAPAAQPGAKRSTQFNESTHNYTQAQAETDLKSLERTTTVLHDSGYQLPAVTYRPDAWKLCVRKEVIYSKYLLMI